MKKVGGPVNDSCVLVFTSRSVDIMRSEAGSQAWVLDPKRARTCRYLVCAWNPTGEYATASHGLSHGEAFLIAPVTSIEAATRPHDPKRYIIRFKEFALVSRPNAWNGQRNPIFYTTLAKVGIDPDILEFSPAAPAAALPSLSLVAKLALSDNGSSGPLTIAAAKTGLALHYGVVPEAVEIIIRG